MSNSLADSFPFPNSIGGTDKMSQTSDQVNETTPGDQDPVSWVEVAVNLSPTEAVIIKGRLESMDIPAIIQQESIGTVMGLTVGPLGSAKVLVPEALVESALAILSDTFEPNENNDSDDDV
jgi:hypothetical protein